MATFTTKSGIELFYEDLGNPDSQNVIVFFNGVMATTSSWNLIYPLFVEMGFRVILHDFKGQLKSSKPEGPYTFLEHVEEAHELFDFLGVNQPHIIGTSYGGEVGMEFATLYPKEVASLSVICSVSELDPVLETFVRQWQQLAQTGDGEKFLLGALPSLYGKTYLHENYVSLTEKAKALKETSSDYLKGQSILYETFLNEINLTQQLQAIKCPTLIISAEGDILKPPHFSEKIVAQIRHAEHVVLPDCGHVAILEKPEILKSLLLGFILKNGTKEKI